MNVLFTIAVFAVIAAWALAVYSRLVRLRRAVKDAWRRLETDQGNAAVGAVYNDRVDRYNAALQTGAASVVAAVSGLQPAKHFEIRDPKSAS